MPLIFIYSDFCHRVVIHPPPSPRTTSTLIRMSGGLVADVLVLNEAAALERMPGNLWGFHWNSLSGIALCLGKYRSGFDKKASFFIFGIPFIKGVSCLHGLGHNKPSRVGKPSGVDSIFQQRDQVGFFRRGSCYRVGHVGSEYF